MLDNNCQFKNMLEELLEWGSIVSDNSDDVDSEEIP